MRNSLDQDDKTRIHLQFTKTVIIAVPVFLTNTNKFINKHLENYCNNLEDLNYVFLLC